MDTALYYLLSTVAQTLAAAIALLGALVLYRLQGVDKATEEESTRLVDNLYSGGEEHLQLSELRRAGRYAAICAHYSKRDPNTMLAYVATLDRLKQLVALRTTLRGRFRESLISTVVVLLLAVTAIPFVPAIMSCPPWALLAAGLTILGFVVCLASYVRLVLTVLP